MTTRAVQWQPAVIPESPQGPLGDDELYVASELVYPDGRTALCPAAPMVIGTLRREGRKTRTGPLRLSPAGTPQAAHAALMESTDGQAIVALAVTAAGPSLAAEGSIEVWSRAMRSRTLLLASPRSFCAGVDRAIVMIEYLLTESDGPVYVRKQIVHNTHVVADLAARGAIFVDELDQVPDEARVVFSAHGVSPQVRAEAQRKRLQVVDATCPLVTKVHSEARRFAERGHTVVLIGHAGHEEIEGTLGQAPEQTVLVEDAADIDRLELPHPSKVSYLTQTTLAVDETSDAIDALMQRFPEAQGPGSDDICYATTNRQHALRGVAERADLVLVIGSANSSNSVRLAELAERFGTPAHLIEDVSHIRPFWLERVTTLGLTAGASAAPGLVHDTVRALAGLGAVLIEEHTTTVENAHFAPPPMMWTRRDNS